MGRWLKKITDVDDWRSHPITPGKQDLCGMAFNGPIDLTTSESTDPPAPFTLKIPALHQF